MLELPGLTNTGDTKKDLDAIRRYLARLVPQLEMELLNAGADGYQDELAARQKHIGTQNDGTTAGALAEHVLDQKNPHRVTLAQLGFSYDQFVQVEITDEALSVRIGKTRGIQMIAQDVTVTVDSWQQTGGVCWADKALGSWRREIPLLIHTGVTLRGATYRDYWAGALSGATREDIGTIRLYHTCDIEVGEDGRNDRTIEDVRTIPMTVFGWGVFGYGAER